jgi:hypothetical protein
LRDDGASEEDIKAAEDELSAAMGFRMIKSNIENQKKQEFSKAAKVKIEASDIHDETKSKLEDAVANADAKKAVVVNTPPEDVAAAVTINQAVDTTA